MQGEREAAMLSVRELVVEYDVGGWFAPRKLRAVNDVSFEVTHGETLGVVGESGCGKSSLARALLRLAPAQQGEMRFCGKDLRTLRGAALRRARKDIQAIFQDPLDSLDPRRTALQSVMEPLEAFAAERSAQERREMALHALEQVAMDAQFAHRYPHELSGGQCQRVGIARAVVARPRLIVCDEAVSALDVAIQEQVLELFARIREQLGVALLFVSHNLAVVRRISHRVMVLYLGQVMELAPSERLYLTPLHPYTQALLSAVPEPDPRRKNSRMRLSGEIPSPLDPPSGCPFRTRCPRATPLCESQRPSFSEASPGHWVACHHWRSP